MMQNKEKAEAVEFEDDKMMTTTTVEIQSKGDLRGVVQDDMIEEEPWMECDEENLQSIDFWDLSRSQRCPSYDSDAFDSLNDDDQRPFSLELRSQKSMNEPKNAYEFPKVLPTPQNPFPSTLPNMSTFDHKSGDHSESQEPSEPHAPHLSPPIGAFEGDLISSLSQGFALKGMLDEPKIGRERNMPKALRNYLENHLNRFKHYFMGFEEEFKRLKKDLRLSKENKNFSLEHLKKMLHQEQQSKSFSDLLRLVFRKILNKEARREIVPDKQVKKKMNYLIATKVFSLRCMNLGLCSRTQMK